MTIEILNYKSMVDVVFVYGTRKLSFVYAKWHFSCYKQSK